MPSTPAKKAMTEMRLGDMGNMEIMLKVDRDGGECEGVLRRGEVRL